MYKAKLVVFLGSCLENLHAFPLDARRETGCQIDKVQGGGVLQTARNGSDNRCWGF